MIEVSRLKGEEIGPWLDDLARLRIGVFREFPYLYDGSEGYERDYLETYAESPRSVIVLATSPDGVVGISTGLPLADADPAFREPFQRAGIDPGTVFYLGESVLGKEHRGQGLGHRFFDEREAHARALGFGITAFCAVVRADDHPLKPDGYRPHDAFWTKRGYRKREDLKAMLEWRQVDSAGEVENVLVFWVRESGL